MLYDVSEDLKRDYSRDGAVCLRGVIPPDRCAQMLAATLEFIDTGEGKGATVRADMPEEGGRYFMAVMMSTAGGPFKEFVAKSPLPGVAAQLMGSSVVRFFYDQLFMMEPGTQRSTPWHNDLPFWPFEGDDIISLWVALTPVTRESSPVQYLAGSHRDGKLYRAVSPQSEPAYPSSELEVCTNYSMPENRVGKRILSWVMDPGDVLAHHPLTAHGAPPNTSKTQRRAAISVRYLGEKVRYRPRDTVPYKRVYDARPGAYPADDVALPVMEIV